MSLSRLWQTSREQFESKHVQQIIAFAGHGKLQDGNATCLEFREFLNSVPSDLLNRYIDECLSASFQDSGLVLQDLVNQIGQRLGFQVEYGRYRGSRTEIGFDGLWRFPDGHAVVVEVKTTDAYRIDTDQIAGYRRRLGIAGRVDEDKSSVLIVVGRQDTGDLEAQIRGSRHAWDIRLISVDALLRMMRLKEAVDDPRIIDRICTILIPREYTRLDEIVDVVFSTAEDAKSPEDLLEDESVETELDGGEGARPLVRPMAFHEACIERFVEAKTISLVRQSRTSYVSPKGDTAVVCAVSKAHLQKSLTSYWFAFHPYQQAILESAVAGYLVLGCGSKQSVLAIPYTDLRAWLDDLWVTERPGRMYWHIRLHEDGRKVFLDRRKGLGKLDVTHYLLPTTAPN